MAKKFKLAAEDIKPLISTQGSCIATDRITVEGYPVRFMYREAPISATDSGWRFLSGFESDAYMEDGGKQSMFELNTIANYDPTIIPFIDAPLGSAFEKTEDSAQFVAVDEWEPDED
jgi:hypothetical protein